MENLGIYCIQDDNLLQEINSMRREFIQDSLELFLENNKKQFNENFYLLMFSTEASLVQRPSTQTTVDAEKPFVEIKVNFETFQMNFSNK